MERTGREGGDEAVERLIRLAKNLGPEAIRAAENAPNASIVIRAIDDLPANLAERAAKRLAAGSEGRALAKTVEEFGANALEAEVRHPGVGGRLVATLGGDGADLASRVKTDQAIEVARHAPDISLLPPSERNQVISLIRENPEGSVAFMKRFVERNPGKVLFTASGTTVILANREAIFGGGEIRYNAKGEPVFVAKPGLAERFIEHAGNRILDIYLPIGAIGLTAFICIGLWHTHKRAGHKTSAIAAASAANERSQSPRSR